MLSDTTNQCQFNSFKMRSETQKWGRACAGYVLCNALWDVLFQWKHSCVAVHLVKDSLSYLKRRVNKCFTSYTETETDWQEINYWSEIEQNSGKWKGHLLYSIKWKITCLILWNMQRPYKDQFNTHLYNVCLSN